MKKNKAIIFLILIILFGFLLRLIGLNKPTGLGYDEAITYLDASNIFPFAQNLIGHMPLYFVLLNLWMKIFSNSDICIRLFSVLCGVIAVPYSYFIGKSLKNKNVGLICALLMAINSTAIYYSQDARFYSLILLLSTVLIFYFINSIKEPSAKNFILLFLAGLLMLYTNIISIIYFGIVLIELIIFYLWKNKNFVKTICINFAILQVILIPFYFMLIKMFNSNAQVIFETRYYDNEVLFSLMQNWFSPVVTGIYNNPAHSFLNFFYTLSSQSIIFVLIPILISLLFIIKNNYKKAENIILLSLAILFIGIEIILSNLGNFIINIRYSIFVLPVLIALIASGTDEFKYKIISKILLCTFILINVFYLIVSPQSAFKQIPLSGQKVPADICKKENIKSGDIVIYQIRDNLSDKYYKTTAKKFKMINIFIETFPKKNENIDNHTYYKGVFIDKTPKAFDYFYKNNIYDKLKSGEKLVIVSQKDFAPYDDNNFSKILANDEIYKKQPFLFLKLYKMQDLFIRDSIDSKLKLKRLYNYQTWNVIIFEK